MRILSIREKTVPLASAMRNASIGFAAMTASALVVETDVMRRGKPVTGLAFDSIGRYGHGGLLRERFIPRLLAADPADYADDANANFDPFKIWAIVMRDEKPGGHGERSGAVGLIDAAIWDLVAKIEEKPLWLVLAERFFDVAQVTSVPVYASGGHYRASDDLLELREEVRRTRDLGYQRFKLKIGGAPLAQDLRRIEAALGVLGSGALLAVDCNGTLALDAALELADALAEYGLAWIEEPVDPLDFDALKTLASQCRTPIATGENIFSAVDTRNLIRHGGLRPERDILQMDISLSYGIVEYLRILDIVAAQGWSRRRCFPHAGHLLAFNVVAGLGLGCHETAPLGDFALGLAVEDGAVRPPEDPGVGFEQHPSFIARFAGLLA